MKTVIILSALLFQHQGFAGSRELAMISGIMSIKDSKTMKNFVEKGNDISVLPRVWVKSKSADIKGHRAWLYKTLPSTMKGYLVREDMGTGLKMKYKVLTFYQNRSGLKCYKDQQTKSLETCEVEYLISDKNIANMDAGKSGKHKVWVKMLPSKNLTFNKNWVKKGSYFVLYTKPRLTQFAQVGLPEF